MSLKAFLKGKKVHFIGIGGISMSALAKYLKSEGYAVGGSDIAVNEEISLLEEAGIPVRIGHDPSAVAGADAVVYTDAVPADDPELAEARERGIPCYSRMQLLAAVAEGFTSVIAVAGSHGKTSATAMCAHILLQSGARFTAHIGGRDALLDNFYASGKEFFVTEACEYRKNLLAFERVTAAVWLNCDKDHMECYRDFDELRDTFLRFAARAARSFVNADDANIRPPENALTFGVSTQNCDYRAVSLRESGERYAFTVLERGEKLCRIRLRVPGAFHVYNALAATAVMRGFGVDIKSIVRGIASFTGVRRRFEKIGKYGGAEFFCDYAHHPAEIAKVLELARRRGSGRLFVVFQPHTYSRTRFLMDDFVKVLSGVENLIIFKTYAAREPFDRAGSAYALHERTGNSLYAESVRELEAYMKKSVRGGDTVLFLGAGDIYYHARRLLQKLGGKPVPGRKGRGGQNSTGSPLDVKE